MIKLGLCEDIRLDGRKPLDYRDVVINLTRYETTSSAIVQIHSTHVICTLHGDIVQPSKDRPNEGIISFSANVSFQTERSGGINSINDSDICRMLERSIKESDAIDLESLCVLVGEKVWHLKCNINVMDCSGGSVLDACSIAAIGAFQAFRKSEISINDNISSIDMNENILIDGNYSHIIVHSTDSREPLPLALHHTPITISFAIFTNINQKTILLVDTTLQEEQIMDGRISFSVNAHNELCGLYKPGLGNISKELILTATHLAYKRCTLLHQLLSNALIDLETTMNNDKIIRLEKLKNINYQRNLLQLNNHHNNNQEQINENVLSWSHLHQSVNSISKSEK